MRTEITTGQTSEYEGFDMVMADKLPPPSVLIADKVYSYCVIKYVAVGFVDMFLRSRDIGRDFVRVRL